MPPRSERPKYNPMDDNDDNENTEVCANVYVYHIPTLKIFAERGYLCGNEKISRLIGSSNKNYSAHLISDPPTAEETSKPQAWERSVPSHATRLVNAVISRILSLSHTYQDGTEAR
ncbi:hypothetical protein EYC84_006870 [Monilinia fructicola]|uniref:Uncharacterized protein n=2 Tax=Monilinia fructicola TaxID=38448 RepID=A0A5M9K7A8_MONFR|nr:hypothetical protein EYC84_006870 [Monilinia fructicola]